jgi:Flp pilus assembly protein TadD
MAHLREALRLRPGYAEAHYNLGMALSRQGALGEATFHLREAVRLHPGNAVAHNNLGVLLARQGAFPEAVAQFREALRLDPGNEGASRNLEFAARDAARSNFRSAAPRK